MLSRGRGGSLFYTTILLITLINVLGSRERIGKPPFFLNLGLGHAVVCGLAAGWEATALLSEREWGDRGQWTAEDDLAQSGCLVSGSVPSAQYTIT